ncbi:hypothetical protein PCANC_24733 [Puccinia coronata f. sp. avenae]|uniref:Uncharacterized protein n=1 Tax=Puccinia coronata f. sp. avenae TaxID=200324 RepID=A0A2N5TZU8_9BASI|nr:hypothetical protein PCANC_24733 [Puccinia coronata f. sp. avenae]
MFLLSFPQLSEKNNHHLLGLSRQQQQSGTGACLSLLRLDKLSSPTTRSLLDQDLTRKTQDSRSSLKTCTVMSPKLIIPFFSSHPSNILDSLHSSKSDLDLCQDLQSGCFSTSSRLFNVLR